LTIIKVKFFSHCSYSLILGVPPSSTGAWSHAAGCLRTGFTKSAN